MDDYKKNSYNSEIKTFHHISQITKNIEISYDILKRQIQNLDIAFPPNTIIGDKDTPTYYFYSFSEIPILK